MKVTQAPEGDESWESAGAYFAALAGRPRRTAPRTAVRSGLHALLARVGHPERRLRAIHIVGSKGKGTVALMLDAILRAGGRRTGVFTSPHLVRWNERIRVDGREIGDAALDAVVARLRPHVAALHARADLNGPEFFEVMLTAALLAFNDAGVSEAVVEAGIGARFDATAVLRPVATAITNVELEHADLLGPDLEHIAFEKAGVARPGVPLVLGRVDARARTVILAEAEAARSPVLMPGAGYRVHLDGDLDAPFADYRSSAGAVRLPLPAPSRALADDAGVALACAEALGVLADPVGAAVKALRALELPGRLEVLEGAPRLVIDAAHTPASLTALAAFLRRVPRDPLHLVVSVSGGRDFVSAARPLLRQANAVTVTRADPQRSADPGALADALRGRFPALAVTVVGQPDAALHAAQARLAGRGTLCATGSVYMAGAARRCFVPRPC